MGILSVAFSGDLTRTKNKVTVTVDESYINFRFGQWKMHFDSLCITTAGYLSTHVSLSCTLFLCPVQKVIFKNGEPHKVRMQGYSTLHMFTVNSPLGGTRLQLLAPGSQSDWFTITSGSADFDLIFADLEAKPQEEAEKPLPFLVHGVIHFEKIAP
jgi:hypothetical protein